MNYKNISIISLVLILGLFLGWVIFSPSGYSTHEEHKHETEASIWTCSMHPQIKQDKPGQCPICAMDLVKLNNFSSSSQESDNIQMSEAAIALADIQTIVIKKGNPIKEIRLNGKIHVDERRMYEIAARFGGRIEKLFVNFNGQKVRKGELLAQIYSPELITAQKELLEAAKNKNSNMAMYKAAVGKLKLWDISDQQIDDIEKEGKAERFFDILSPISGTVSMRFIKQGNYVKKGQTLLKMVDLSHLWVLFDAYESDLPWIRLKDKMKFKISAIPGEQFMAEVTYIDPFINSKTRIAKIRTEINNESNNIKPQMFVKGIIESNISLDSKEIIIPKSSILWTGKRAVVYVKIPLKDSPTFEYREIILGPDMGSSYMVKKGLQEGEEIAVNGVFKIDAAAQLRGLTSMMNPKKSELLDVDELFTEQLTSFYMDYLKLKDVFILSDFKKIAKAVHLLHSSIEAIDMKLLKGDAHIKWMKIQDKLNKNISDIVNSKSVDSQRLAFASLSVSLFNAIKTFGLKETTYYHFCPMADDNKGAYWLSDSDKVRNPYFGDMMLECGEVKEVIR